MKSHILSVLPDWSEKLYEEKQGRIYKGKYKGVWGFPGGSVVKNLPANAGDSGNEGSIPGLGRSSGEGHGHPLWYSCLENPTDREGWRATVHGVTKSQIQLK